MRLFSSRKQCMIQRRFKSKVNFELMSIFIKRHWMRLFREFYGKPGFYGRITGYSIVEI